MSNWLNELVSQHDELEAPRAFWYWAGLAAISAVVKDNIWMGRQIHKLYPNVYIMFHADSGLKKGPPVSMAKQLVTAVNNTKVIGGRSSVQGILKEMGKGNTEPGGKVKLNSTAFICSSELSSAVVEDPVATKILTDLYDRQYNIGEWKSLLKAEEFQLKDPTVTMLTATNEAMSEDFFKKSAIQGGYFARTFIIYEKKSQAINSLIYPLVTTPNYIQSASYLKDISKLNGEFHPLAQLAKNDEYRFKKIKGTASKPREVYFNTVGIIYDDWYEAFIKEIQHPDSVKDDTGTLNRFGDSVLKVAMLLSLAEQPALVISESAMNSAINECEKLLGSVRKVTLGKQGISESSVIKTLIILEFINKEDHSIMRTHLMKKLWTHYKSADEFDQIMLAFHHSGMIITTNIASNILYVMPQEQVLEMKRFLAGKQGLK